MATSHFKVLLPISCFCSCIANHLKALLFKIRTAVASLVFGQPGSRGLSWTLRRVLWCGSRPPSGAVLALGCGLSSGQPLSPQQPPSGSFSRGWERAERDARRQPSRVPGLELTQRHFLWLLSASTNIKLPRFKKRGNDSTPQEQDTGPGLQGATTGEHEVGSNQRSP